MPVLGRIGYYAGYVCQAVVRREIRPLIFGIAITDRCNLSCEGSRLSGEKGPPGAS